MKNQETNARPEKFSRHFPTFVKMKDGLVKMKRTFMKRKRILFPVIGIVALGVFVWFAPTQRSKQEMAQDLAFWIKDWWRAKPDQPEVYTPEQMALIRSNLDVRILSLRAEKAPEMPLPPTGRRRGMPLPPDKTDPPAKADPKYFNPADWPSDDRPEVIALYAFAHTAKLYNFDPQITSVATNSDGQVISVATPNYNADFDRGSISFVGSKYDAIENVLDYPEARQSWSEGRGTWHQKDLLDQTRLLLRGFAFPYMRQIPVDGKWEAQFPKYVAPSSNGELEAYYPFAIVLLHDPTHYEDIRVRAQYRLGTDGTPQLVSWFAR